MSNKIQTFVHERFGKIRVVMINGEPHFVAADVCKALGYTNSRKALRDHVPDKFKRVLTAKDLQQMASNQDSNDSLHLFSEDAMGGVQRLTFVSEPSVYRLIMRSKLPKAEEFTDWVCGEVLVSIRKTGSYSLFDKPAAEQKPRKCHDIIAGYAFVYVFLLSNDKVKIGCNGNPRARAAEIKRKTGLTIKRVYLSPAMPRERAFFVEWACQENFSSSRVKGEIFSVDFAEVCAVLDIFANKISLPLNSKLNIATVNLIAAEKSE